MNMQERYRTDLDVYYLLLTVHQPVTNFVSLFGAGPIVQMGFIKAFVVESQNDTMRAVRVVPSKTKTTS